MTLFPKYALRKLVLLRRLIGQVRIRFGIW